MTPAQLGVLIDQHNELHDPDHKGKHRRGRSGGARQYDDPADLLALSGMKLGG